MHEIEYFDESEGPIQDEELQEIPFRPPVPDEITIPPPQNITTPPRGLDPGNKVLFDYTRIEPPRKDSDTSEETLDEVFEPSPAMPNSAPLAGSDDAPAASAIVSPASDLTGASRSLGQQTQSSVASGARLKATAELAILESDRHALTGPTASASSTGAVRDIETDLHTQSQHTHPLPGAPLRIQPPAAHTLPPLEDNLAKSPVLRKHLFPVDGSIENTLPAVQAASPTKEGNAISPQTTLPPIRQAIGPLNELAEAASQQRLQTHHPPSRHHSHSFSSATSPSHPYFQFPANAQASPGAYPFNARSPTSTIGGSPRRDSQAAFPGFAQPYPRKTSAPTEYDAHSLPALRSHPSISSSGESHGTAASSTDGISTAHTTPIDCDQVEDSPGRIILPPPTSGMQVIPPPGGYKCNYPGCTAVPFQTQYLLSSHKNVHSTSRPHYCPVEGCSRSEEGKGFKRKNEMIRHGLVHDSPGFICPYCPDREHRYPRPDNLQRHVRVHHMDKDRDDPALLKVLNQRVQGASGKQRRRRSQAQGSAAQQDPSGQ